jgi:hypothetical protein
MTSANMLLYAIIFSFIAFFTPMGVGMYRNYCIDIWRAGTTYHGFRIDARNARYFIMMLTLVMIFCATVSLGILNGANMRYIFLGSFFVALCVLIASTLFNSTIHFLLALLFLTVALGALGYSVETAALLGSIIALLSVIHSRACKIYILN